MRLPVMLAVVAVAASAACAGSPVSGIDEAAVPNRGDTSSAVTTTTPPTTTTPTTTIGTTSTTTTTTSTTTTTTTSSTTTTTTSPVEPLPDPSMPAANRAFDDLARANPAATMTVVRDDLVVLRRASGTTIDGGVATSDSPMVVASISKLLTALMIARLAHSGTLDVDAPMPWGDLGVAAHPDWSDVAVRELLDHTSGMPVVRRAWFDGGIDCATFLPSLLEEPPAGTRGRWTYSNGNYCALGLLVQHLTWLPLDQAAQSILFEPLGLAGVHLTTDGQLPTDVEYRPGVARLSRLGGAGGFIVSTDDMAAVLASVTPDDLSVIRWPGLIIDQYGWGHTGSVDEAVACAWLLEGGRTVVTATVAGPTPATGGDVCDQVVRAVAQDLGVDQGPPDRSPP